MARSTSNLDRLMGELSSVKDTVAQLMRERASAAGESVRGAAEDVRAEAAEKADEAVNTVRDRIRLHPLVSIAGAFGLGLSIAHLLRR